MVPLRDKVASLSGKTVSGGRLNAASAVGYVEPPPVKPPPTDPVDACPEMAGVQASPEECAPTVGDEEAAQTGLTLSASSNAIDYRKSVTLSGTLKTKEGAPVGNADVRLERAPVGSDSFSAFKTVATSADGAFAHSFAPEQSHRYRAVYAGESGVLAASTSAERTVGVRALVTNATSTKKVKIGRSKTITGTVAPNHAGEAVRITVSGGGATKTLSDTLDASSKFAAGFKAKKKGTYTVRVFFGGDADHLDGESPAKKFRVLGKRR